MPSPPDGAGTRPLVLASDLDGTLVAVNTFPRFVVFALWRLVGQGEVAAGVGLATALLRRKLGRMSHLRFKEVVHDAALLLPPASVSAWAQRVLTRHAHLDVAALVRDWQGTTVLCTAAPQPYAVAFGMLLDMDVVQGSTRTGGAFVENVSTEKAALLRAGLPAGVECAITDDPLIDAPLLALAHRPLVVDRSGRIGGVARGETGA